MRPDGRGGIPCVCVLVCDSDFILFCNVRMAGVLAVPRVACPCALPIRTEPRNAVENSDGQVEPVFRLPVPCGVVSSQSESLPWGAWWHSNFMKSITASPNHPRRKRWSVK
eukprot:scaffold1769_cov185-Amphora_coffeaeformis.AAC.2